MAAIREVDYLHYFLTGLDDPYKAIRAHLLAQTPLPSVETSYQTEINTERLCAKEGRLKENVMTVGLDVLLGCLEGFDFEGVMSLKCVTRYFLIELNIVYQHNLSF